MLKKLRKTAGILSVLFVGLVVLSGCNASSDTENSVEKGTAPDNVEINYGESDIYSQQDMDDAIQKIMEEFNTWKGCTLNTISYTNDEHSKEEGKNYADDEECIVFESSFHTSDKVDGSWEANEDYNGWSWILVRKNGGQWELVNWGYG